MDLPGWQAIYEELQDQGFELISAAQDTGGEEAAGRWFDRAKPTFTQIIDEKHVISALFNMVNVPSGVWIDEQGQIVRPPEVAYSSTVDANFGGKKLHADGDAYVAALRDWVAKGADSEYAMSAEEVTGKLEPRSDNEAKAEAAFQLGVYFHANDKEDLANTYWEMAQELRPDDWNYHRQDWSFTPKEAGAKWMKKFKALGDEDYYAPLEIAPSAPSKSD